MIGVKSHAAKAIDAVERNQAALDRANLALSQHDVLQPAGDDADAVFTWKRERRELIDRVEACREALAFSEARAEQARAEEAERARDAAHVAALKLARASEKLVLEITQDAEKLAGKLAALEANRAEIAGANAVRGSRDFIVDGETRIRGIPAATIPARFETRDVWEDAQGNQPSQYRQDEAGEIVPRGGAFTKVRKSVQIRAETYVPPRMPERFATALKLVGLKGESLWPR